MQRGIFVSVDGGFTFLAVRYFFFSLPRTNVLENQVISSEVINSLLVYSFHQKSISVEVSRLVVRN